MTPEVGFLWVAEVLFLVALACFLKAFAVRRTDLAAHKRWGKGGAYLVFGGLLILEVLLRALGWEFPIRSRPWLIAHISCASVSTLLLIIITVTGYTGSRWLHVRMWPLFLPLFTATIVLSFFAFRLW